MSPNDPIRDNLPPVTPARDLGASATSRAVCGRSPALEGDTTCRESGRRVTPYRGQLPIIECANAAATPSAASSGFGASFSRSSLDTMKPT